MAPLGILHGRGVCDNPIEGPAEFDRPLAYSYEIWLLCFLFYVKVQLDNFTAANGTTPATVAIGIATGRHTRIRGVHLNWQLRRLRKSSHSVLM